MSLIEALDPNNGAAIERLATALADRIVSALRVEAAASDDLIFDTKQAAKMTGLSPRTLEMLRSTAKGPCASGFPACLSATGLARFAHGSDRARDTATARSHPRFPPPPSNSKRRQSLAETDGAALFKRDVPGQTGRRKYSAPERFPQ